MSYFYHFHSMNPVSCFRINQLMRKYCEEAVSYGDTPQPVTAKQKTVLVILNPVADKKSASESVCFSHLNTPEPCTHDTQLLSTFVTCTC